MRSTSRTILRTSLLAALVFTTAGAGSDEEFDEFEVFIEINATDGDAGFQGKLDGSAWKRTTVFGPRHTTLFHLRPSHSLGKRGVTEFVWESAEPPFDTGATLEEFLAMFPAGPYTAEGKKLGGDELFGETELTHDLPGPPEITSPEEEAAVDPGLDLFVTWLEVVDDFQRPGQGDLGSDIVRYSVTVETEFEILGEEVKEVLDLDVPPDSFSTTIPADFLKADRHYKVEIGATEESGNSTFSEVEFCTFAGECPDEE